MHRPRPRRDVRADSVTRWPVALDVHAAVGVRAAVREVRSDSRGAAWAKGS